MLTIRACFFDVFGTLVDWRSGVAREARRILEPLGGAEPAVSKLNRHVSGRDLCFGLREFAAAFLDEYWLHFELVSVLLVAAVVAAVAVIDVNRGNRG